MMKLKSVLNSKKKGIYNVEIQITLDEAELLEKYAKAVAVIIRNHIADTGTLKVVK